MTHGRTNRRTDGQTDRRTDRGTDKASYRVACLQLKKEQVEESMNLHLLKVEFCSGGSVRARFKCSLLLNIIMTSQVSINNNQQATLLTFE